MVWSGPFKGRDEVKKWDGWKTDVAGHYRTHHGPLSDPDALAADEARRRPARRILA